MTKGGRKEGDGYTKGKTVKETEVTGLADQTDKEASGGGGGG